MLACSNRTRRSNQTRRSERDPELRSSDLLQPRVQTRGANLGTETNHEVMAFNSLENQPLIIYSNSHLNVNNEDTRGGARAASQMNS